MVKSLDKLRRRRNNQFIVKREMTSAKTPTASLAVLGLISDYCYVTIKTSVSNCYFIYFIILTINYISLISSLTILVLL